MRIVTYYRVSTLKQGQSGLGFDAQRAAVQTYAEQVGAKVLASYTEVESGKLDQRPQLALALHHAKVTGATLVIAKLDRLSRSAEFLLRLKNSGAKFIAADIRDANDLTVGILALVAEQEAKAISRRTKDALAAAKVRGARLGNPNGARALLAAARGNGAALEVIKAKADAHAADLRPVLRALEDAGVRSLGAIAAELNAREIQTPRGGQWHKSSVRNLLSRLPSD